MLLSLLTGPEMSAPGALSGIEVTGITADSRAVKPGFLFAALPGTKVDGTRFIAEAIGKGAVAVLAKEGTSVRVPASVPVLRAAEPRRALALMAARFHAAQPPVTVAVTGTNGKTSVAEFTRQIFATLGHTAASLGTIGLVKPDGSIYGSLTTPDPVSLHATLAGLASEGITHLAFEASSHGLDQYRLDGVRLAAAAFTNLGRDHLDYHADENAYLAAKMRLFAELLQPRQPAVINADGARATDALVVAKARDLNLFTTGAAGEHLHLVSLARDGFAQRIVVRHNGRDFSLHFPLLGSYQVENALVAAGLAIVTGSEPAATIDAIQNLTGVKGRLEVVGQVRGGLVVVDYAHKPEALAAALNALRPFASGRLICVFGCGGDRDKGKRPIMGRIAADKADRVIITDDNPRSEPPERVRAEIIAGASDALEIGDRALAIHAAIASLSKGDVALIAGKGHETGQILGNTVIPFSDHDVAMEEIARETRNG
jgi:UDP-N-acetylmuramoyl-L-alanyl-D-glutamate--2,6-diaminopimelate ligase